MCKGRAKDKGVVPVRVPREVVVRAGEGEAELAGDEMGGDHRPGGKRWRPDQA